MSKKLLIMFVISVTTMASYSQGFEVGFKGGATINKITGKSFNEQFTYGYNIGAYAAIKLTNKFAFQPEVLFNQVNLDTSNDYSSIYKFNKLNHISLKYLSIPLLLDYKANKLITLLAGPQFGILMNKSKTLMENGKNAFKTGDLSMLAGIQLNLLSFKIYGRYVIGLNNINDISNQDKWQNRSIQVGVGFKL